MKIVAFQPDHLKRLRLQPAQAWMQPLVDEPAYLECLLRADSYTAFNGGSVVAVAGLVTIWPGRAHLSALLSDEFGAGNGFLLFHRETLRRMEACPIARIEATVDDDFKEGRRWLGMLGFHLETPLGMKGYMPDGRTSYLYARVKP